MKKIALFVIVLMVCALSLSSCAVTDDAAVYYPTNTYYVPRYVPVYTYPYYRPYYYRPAPPPPPRHHRSTSQRGHRR